MACVKSVLWSEIKTEVHTSIMIGKTVTLHLGGGATGVLLGRGWVIYIYSNFTSEANTAGCKQINKLLFLVIYWVCGLYCT